MPTTVKSRDIRPCVKTVKSEGGRFAAILDLEGIAIMGGGRVSPAEMQVLLNAVGSHVAGMPVRLATGVNILRAYMDLIGPLNRTLPSWKAGWVHALTSSNLVSSAL